jgi:single-strand DNA-binding protein
MAGSLNKVMIIGNLGRDPELRYTQRGTPVCNFTVAVNRPGRVDDATGQRGEDETEWFAVVAWDKLAETCSQYLAKGRKVYIEGRLQTRSWEGQDGQKRSRVEVLAQQMVMLDAKGQSSDDGGGLVGAGASALGASGRGAAAEEDELPF